MKPSLIVVGLGNPGKSYIQTRHNAGFRAIDALSREFGVGEWELKEKFRSKVQEARVVTAPVLLVKPETYMNLCGETVKKLVTFYKIDPKAQLLILSDDVDIPLGSMRFRRKGGPGTHNGMKSIVEQLGEEFPRLRIGIGPQPPVGDLATWVLSAFSPTEEEELRNTLERIPDMVRQFVLGASEDDACAD